MFMLLGHEQFAESGDDLEKGDLIIADPTTKLVDRGQDPDDVVLACGVVIHVRELMEDRIIALTKEGSSEGNFVVVVSAFIFAVCGVLDLEDDLRFVVKIIQRGLDKLEIFVVT